MNEPLAKYNCNGFVINPYASIALATMSGMGLMFLGTTAGLPIYICMALLLGGILLVYGFFIASMEYVLFEEGIQQTMRRKLPNYFKKHEEIRFITWQEITSFKTGKDMKRSGGEYEYLKLYVKKSPGEIWITDEANPDAFTTFKHAFFDKVDALEALLTSTTNATKTATQEAVVIKQKKDFYDTLFAKILTVFFMVVTLALFYFALTMNASATVWWRLIMVMVPGTIYMAYRTFRKKA